MSDEAWIRLNRKAVTYIKMAMTDETVVDLKSLTNAYDVCQKLNAVYENTTPINQVHLKRKLVGMQLDESKSAAEHLSLFTSILSQLQDSGLLPLDDKHDKLKAIFLLTTLPDSWETLVVLLVGLFDLSFPILDCYVEEFSTTWSPSASLSLSISVVLSLEVQRV
ncbi:hypothetical protein L7F22_034839 [Adiantum nelumboides]|nr:hypothetical protein [Adiantum nelumboides]